LVLAGCGYKEVDLNVVGAEKVPGAGTMYVMCTPEGTVIYFTKQSGGEDNYEAFFANACRRDPATGRIIFTYDTATRTQGANQPLPDGDLGNTQPGTEEGG
jgi:hypothetical protein